MMASVRMTRCAMVVHESCVICGDVNGVRTLGDYTRLAVASGLMTCGAGPGSA